MPLFGIYVYHEDGQLMFSRDFPHEIAAIKRSNPNLISGLMAALGTLSASIGGGGIKRVQMDNFSITGIHSPSFCVNFLAICDQMDDPGQIFALLKRLRRSFTQKFSKILKRINDGDIVNTETFEEWNNRFDEFVKEYDSSNLESAMSNTLKDLISKFKDH